MFLKWIGKITTYTFVVLLTLYTATVVFLHFYQDKIQEVVVHELNKHVKTPISINYARLSLTDNFPELSLHIRGLKLQGSSESEEEFLQARHVYLAVDFWELWKGNYEIKKAEIIGGDCILMTDQKGNINYEVFEKSDSSSSEFSLALKKVDVLDTKIRYRDYKRKTHQDYYVSSCELKGNFEVATTLETVINGSIDRFDLDQITSNVSLPLKLETRVVLNDKDIQIESGQLYIGDMLFKLAFSKQGDHITCNGSGQNIALQNLLTSINHPSFKQLREMKSSGTINASFAYNSATPKKLFTSNFNLQNGAIQEQSTQKQLEKIELKGDILITNNSSSNRLSLKEFSFSTSEKDAFSGSAFLTNFKRPNIKLAGKGNLELNNISQFISIPEIRSIHGKTIFDFEVKLTKKEDAYRLVYQKGTGMLTEGLTKLTLAKSPLNIPTVEWALQQNSITLKNLSASMGKNSIQGNFKISRLFSAYPPQISGKIASDRLDLSNLLEQFNTTGNTQNMSNEAIPSELDIKLQGSIKSFTYQNKKFSNTLGKVVIKNKVVSIPYFRTQHAGATMSGNLVLKNQFGKRIDGKINYQIDNASLKQVFAEWDNFNQTVITDANLNGELYSKGSIAFVSDQYGVVKPKSYSGKASFSITNGEIHNLSMLNDIAAYLKNNKLAKTVFGKDLNTFTSRLKQVKFKEIRNEVGFSKGGIEFPEMLIENSALNVKVSGTQNFDGYMKYSFQFNIKDIRPKEEITEYGIVVNDAKGFEVFIRVEGYPDDLKITWDKPQAKKNFKKRVAEEKQTIKSVLKTELGLFNNDTTVQTIREEENDFEMFVLDSAGQTPLDQQKEETPKKEVRQSNKTEEQEFDFEIDE